jgi:hypothetical protein
MIDHTTHLQVQGRMADRQAEARARRLAAEAGDADVERTFWATDVIRSGLTGGGSVLARLRGIRVRRGSTLTPTGYRA